MIVVSDCWTCDKRFKCERRSVMCEYADRLNSNPWATVKGTWGDVSEKYGFDIAFIKCKEVDTNDKI